MEITFLILLSLALLFFGVSSFLSNRKSKTNRYFLLFILCMILWIFSNYFSNSSSAYNIVLLTNRLIFVSTSLLAWTIFLFSFVYPNSNVQIKKSIFIPSLLFTLAVLILDISPYVVRNVEIQNGYSSIDFGVGIYLYLLHFVFFFVLFIFTLVKKYTKAEGLEKVQIQYLILGIVLSAVGATITNLILPIVFKIFYLSNYGPVFLVIFVGFTFLSIVKHRFLGIRFLVGRIILFFFLSLFLLLSFFLFGWIASEFLGGLFKSSAILISVIIAPIYAWIFLKFNNFVEKVVEDKLVYTKLHPEEALSKFLRQSSTELDMEKISVYLINVIKKYLNLEKVGVILFEKDSNKVIYKKLVNFNLENLRDLLQVNNYWKDIGEDPILVLEEAKRLQGNDKGKRLERIIECMESEDISAILPLNRKVQLNGIIIVGRKKNGDPLSVEDINFLEDIIANASVAMGRAILYKEVQGFNLTLKEKVADQTKELRSKVILLNEARKKEHEMTDIMGHELRTPMSVIRNYHQLLDNLLKKGKVYTKEGNIGDKSRAYMEILEKNIKREIDLINALLSGAKLDNGKLELNREEVNMTEIIKDGMLAHEREAKEKNLYLKFNSANGKVLPNVFADRVRVHEIVDNLISNAIKYTEKGGVEVSISNVDNYVKIDISDTGVGIPESDIQNIGKRFFRSNQYINKNSNTVPLVRPGGTGLGLFVTFGLIKAHGGKIEVKSKLNKGSSFIVYLPVFKKGDTEKVALENKGDMFERLGLVKGNNKH